MGGSSRGSNERSEGVETVADPNVGNGSKSPDGRSGNARPPVSKGTRTAASGFGMAFSLAFEFAGAVALFWLLGWLVDRWLDISPWGQVSGAVVGWIGGILHVYYAVERLNEREKRGRST